MRTKSAFKNVLSSIGVQAVIVICGLVLPRLLIETYGSTVNGLVSTVKQLLTYFSVVSLGLGSVAAVALYKPLAEQDVGKISGVLSATRLFYNKTGYFFGALVLLTAFFLPRQASDGLNPQLIAALVLVCGVGAFCEHIVVSKYRVLLIADQKNYVVSNIVSQGIIAYTVLAVVLIKLGFSILVIQAVSTAAYLFRLLLLARYIRRHYPQADFYAEPDFDAIADRWEAFAYQFPGMVINYTPIVIIALFLGFNEASIYAVYNMVYSSMAMIVSVFSSGFSASFGNVLAQDDRATLQKSFATYEFIFRNVLFFCYTCALTLTLPFVSVYVKANDGVNYVLPTVSLLFAFNRLFSSMFEPAVVLVNAAGRFKENKWPNIIEAFANAVLSVALVHPFGIAGILLAATATGLIRGLVYLAFSYKKILEMPYFATLAKLGANILLMTALFALLRDITCSSLSEWLYKACGVAGVCLAAVVALNCSLDVAAAKDVLARLKLLLNKGDSPEKM